VKEVRAPDWGAGRRDDQANIAHLPALWRPTGSDRASAGVAEGKGGTRVVDEIFVALWSLLMVTAIAAHAGESAGAFPKVCSTNLFWEMLYTPRIEVVIVQCKEVEGLSNVLNRGGSVFEVRFKSVNLAAEIVDE
jgi:hypothetical protein